MGAELNDTQRFPVILNISSFFCKMSFTNALTYHDEACLCVIGIWVVMYAMCILICCFLLIWESAELPVHQFEFHCEHIHQIWLRSLSDHDGKKLLNSFWYIKPFSIMAFLIIIIKIIIYYLTVSKQVSGKKPLFLEHVNTVRVTHQSILYLCVKL